MYSGSRTTRGNFPEFRNTPYLGDAGLSVTDRFRFEHFLEFKRSAGILAGSDRNIAGSLERRQCFEVLGRENRLFQPVQPVLA
jgi:hypothetical protein